ncbi:hypothetical protein HSBAA_61250 [Vreelandella sulfidaeris]|uniref:Uncharacterized protein n=1 Tax=Vreelandella sulfidaeris TaxID=115553 RepID=A0A455UKP9_9GAMM|nr:hypothetical protein HSBAA_61250 [Halomonas sulfidaeris]
MPNFRLAGRLNRDHQQWNATGLEGEIGSTNVTGRLEVLTTEHPVVDIVVNAGRIYLSELIAAANREPDDEAQDVSPFGTVTQFRWAA